MIFKCIAAITLLAVANGDGEVPCRIPGPRNTSHNIAIVGAGAAGVHMALRLKQKGFTRVTVYEQASVPGGDEFSMNHRGTTFVYPARVKFETALKSLMDKYAASDLVELAPSTKWSSIRSNNDLEEFTSRQYALERGKKQLNTQNETAVKIIMMNTLFNYQNIHNNIFSLGSPCSFYKEPAWGSDKFDTTGTFRNFLDRYNLRLLDPLFEESTLLGKGYMDEIPATYGLLMFNPNVVNQMIKFVNDSQPASYVHYAIKSGERQLWQAIINAENLNVQFNSLVDRLRRDSLTEGTEVHLRVNSQWRTYQFVIWTGDMKTAIQKYWSWKRPEFNAGPSHEEYQNFLRFNQDVTALGRSIYLFDSELLGRGNSYIDEFPDDVQNKRNGIYQMYDTYAINNGQTNQNLYRVNGYQNKNADNSEFRTLMAVNFYRQGANSIYGDFSKVENMFTPANVSYTGLTPNIYFPRYSSSDALNGMLWRIMAMQGKAGVWYTGKSVYVDDVNMVLQYNEILLNKMKDAVN